MLKRISCRACNGSGLIMLQTKALWGLMTKETPQSCSECQGRGNSWELAACTFCEGRGLLGNESEVCRSCNGTGHADTFAFIPQDQLKQGLVFQRRCEKCGNSQFKLATGITQHKVVKSWDAHEELRQVEYQDGCEVACTSCGHHYSIPIDPEWHQRLDAEHYAVIEDMGMHLDFLYKPLNA